MVISLTGWGLKIGINSKLYQQTYYEAVIFSLSSANSFRFSFDLERTSQGTVK